MSSVTLDAARAERIIKAKAPELDDFILSYILDYMHNPPADAFETVGEDLDAEGDGKISGFANFVHTFLDDARVSAPEARLLEGQLFAILPQTDASRRVSKATKLEKPVHLLSTTALSATAKLASRNTDLEWVSGARQGVSMVDSKKLEKAEAKIKAKMEKRNAKADYQASRILQKEKTDEDLLKINPVMDYTSTRGKSKDVKVENFDISFAGKRILTGADLTLTFGRRYGLIGRNGIGKSTLLRTLSQREVNVATHISILHVEQEMVGDDTSAIQAVLSADLWREHLLKEERDLSARLNETDGSPSKSAAADGADPAATASASDPVDPASQTDEQKTATLAADAERAQFAQRLREVYAKLEEIESDKAESRAAAILAGLGFSPEQHQNATRTFSGGWRMRLSLARALFCKPDLLLLDEPTNMLDIPAVVWLENYLKTWPNTLLVVSHDREFLDEVATDILHHFSEKLNYYKGNYSQFEATRTERRKNQQREYDTQLQYRQHLQDFIDRWRYNAKRAPQAQSKMKILEKLPVLEPPEDEATINFRFPDTESLGPPILQMTEVAFGYKPGSTILSGVNLDMQMDSRIAVVGPNGAGKSTMLKLLTEQLEPRAGTVHRHGRLRFAFFSQHHVDQLDLSVSSVAYLARRFPGRTEEEYRRHLGSFGIGGMVGLQPIHTLSGGQKSRVAFSVMSMQNPHFLILDEPTNHLDMDSLDALQRALLQFQGGVVIVSHDERFIDAVCNEIWVCDGGKLTKFRGEGIKDYKKIICPEAY